MTFVPKYASPCDLASNLPDAIAELLQADTDLRKRFREETVTDLVVASLKALPLPNLTVAVPVEKVTGSDFDITIVAKDRSDAIQFRLQAKRLHAHAKNWKIGSYKELAYPNNTGAQASTLIRSSASERIMTIPLYAFYNPQHSIAQSRGAISGFDLASGYAISRIVGKLVKAKPKRPPYKRVGKLQPLFFPLTKLLCDPFMRDPTRGDGRSAPPPRVFRQAIEKEISSRLAPHVGEDLMPGLAISRDDAEKQLSDYGKRSLARSTGLPVPYDSERMRTKEVLPSYMREILDTGGGGRIIQGPVKRPKIIIQSDGE